MSTTTKQANWNQIYALLALNAAVVISWIAYHNYQPKVLELFHFQELSFFLVVSQAIILIFIPSAAGWIGDSLIKKGGSSFIVFTVGVSVTAMIFMCVAFTVGASSTIDLTAALPFMIVLWLISMNIFHSPANSMLELFAPAKQLPAAMALMVMTTDLLYAFENQVVSFVDFIGPVYTFALGGVLLIITGYFFRRSTKQVDLKREYDEADQRESKFGNVLLAGIFLGIATAAIKNLLPNWLPASDTWLNASWLVSFVLVVAALAAWPLSIYINKIGVRQALVYGIIGTFVGLAASYFLSTSLMIAVPICVVIGLSYSLASVSAFPTALHNLSPRSITLGAGVFFGSVELAEGLLNIYEHM